MTGLTEVTIKRKQAWADGLMTIEVDHTPPEFTAGQFFNLGLEIKGEVVRRSYSAASAPGAPLEFFLSRVQEGGLTPRLFDLKEGETILLDEQPLGFFTLREVPPARTLWLVATGTGLGPYISMLRGSDVLRRFEKVNVVHGVRDASSLAYADELKKLAQAHTCLNYAPTVSGAGEPAEGALSGRITEAFESGKLEEACGAFDQDAHMLLCGNPRMIEDMVVLLKARGFEKHRRRKAGHFNFEKYW